MGAFKQGCCSLVHLQEASSVIAAVQKELRGSVAAQWARCWLIKELSFPEEGFGPPGRGAASVRRQLQAWKLVEGGTGWRAGLLNSPGKNSRRRC